MLATVLQGTRDRRKSRRGEPELRAPGLCLVTQRLRGFRERGRRGLVVAVCAEAPGTLCCSRRGCTPRYLFFYDPNYAHQARRCPVSPEFKSKGQVMPFSSCWEAPFTTAPFPPSGADPTWGAPWAPEDLTPGWGRS